MPSFFKNFMMTVLTLALIGTIFVLKPFQGTVKPSHETLIVGSQSGYPPFEFMDDHGKMVGFDIDLAEHIAKKLEKTLIIKDMDFEGVILSLKQGKLDLIMSGMNITPSRLKEISMVPYHGEEATSLSLVFWNEIPHGVKSLEDIANLPNPAVSVETGSIPETYLNHRQGIQVKSFLGALSSLMDVKYGKSVASLVEPDVAKYLAKHYSQVKILDVPLSKDENILGCGIGVKKENKELFQQIQQIIHEFKTSGELALLEDKWFKGAE
jgi:arginine transport system substrate-binding protein